MNYNLPLRQAWWQSPVEVSSSVFSGGARRVQTLKVMKSDELFFFFQRVLTVWLSHHIVFRNTLLHVDALCVLFLLSCPTCERLWLTAKSAQSTTATMTQVSTRSILYFRSGLGQRTRSECEDCVCGMSAVIYYNQHVPRGSEWNMCVYTKKQPGDISSFNPHACVRTRDECHSKKSEHICRNTSYTSFGVPSKRMNHTSWLPLSPPLSTSCLLKTEGNAEEL